MTRSAAYRRVAVILLLVVAPLLLPGVCQGQPAVKPAQPRGPAWVIERLKNGINTDFTFTNFPDKVLYEPAYFDAVVAAGFQSVRIFAGYDVENPGIHAQAIKDAIDRDLVIVFLYFGNKTGKDGFLNSWRAIAEYYRDYPENLVFEILNEPAFGPGIKDNDVVSDWYNSVIPEIRKTNPTRILLLGGPHFNEIELGVKYLTSEHLTYKLEDGTGFADDKNILGAFHHYVPGGVAVPQGKYVRLRNFPNWKTEITQGLDQVVNWSEKHHKPAIITEWGAFTCTIDRAELLEYTRFMSSEIRKRDIGSMYYTAFFSNEWVWSIFDSEWGWDPDLLDILTGVKAPPPPPTNALVNPEFNRWSVSDPARVAVVWNAGLSGKSALKVTLPGDSAQAAIHQESNYLYPFQQGTLKNYRKPLLHLRKGNTYKLTFCARAEKPGAVIKARFEEAPGNGLALWTSDPVTVDTENREYVLAYTHECDDLRDLRLTFLFEGSNNTVYFDKVALRSTRND